MVNFDIKTPTAGYLFFNEENAKFIMLHPSQ